MSFWDSCEHDWKPSAKVVAQPQFLEAQRCTGETVRLMADLARGGTTLFYQCSKCKDLRREFADGVGDFVDGGKA